MKTSGNEKTSISRFVDFRGRLKQEISTIVKLLELAYFKDGFPSCSRSHYYPTFLTLQVKFSGGQNHKEKTHSEGLSYFVQNVEQINEFDVESTRIRTKTDVKVNNSNSARKKSRKFHLAQKVIVRARPLFLRKGCNVTFNFQHSASPEKVLREYIRVNIYNKNRLSRIDKKKISEAVYFLHGVQVNSEVDLRESKSKVRSKHENDEKRISTRRSKVKRNINTGDVCSRIKLTRSWQPVQRIPATSNFVYEFNPFDNIQIDNSSKGLRRLEDLKNLCSSINCSKGLSSSKSTTTVKRDVKKVKTRSIASLPKLNSNPGCMVNFTDRQEKTIRLQNEATLPFIQKTQERKKNEVIFKESDKNCKMRPAELSVINQDVEKVKSNWQRYRKSHASNPAPRKLCNILKNAACELNLIEKSIDLAQNRYLRKSATKLSMNAESITEQDDEHIRKPTKSFIKRDCWPNYKSINTTSTNLQIKGDEEEINGKRKKEILKQSPFFMEKRLWSIDDVFDLKSNILLNGRDKSKWHNEMIAKTSVLKNEKSSKVNSGIINRYLKGNIVNDNKFDAIEQNKAQQHPNFKTSSECITDRFATLNLNTSESQNVIEKNINDDLEYPGCKNGNEMAQHLKEEESASAKSSGEHKYAETCFNELNLPEDILGQVLQSKYLRKDLLSLHSM